LTVIGMVGQYVARIYDEVRARPLYLVRESRGLTPDGPGDTDALWSAGRRDSLVNGQPVPPS
jgi:dolichol-phosphate mannosyltransferase